MASISYEDIPRILEGDNPEEVLYVPILVSMYDDDQEFCEKICLRLSKHEHYNVRGNAILGFGHIIRRFGNYLNNEVPSIVNLALLDREEYVRGQADAAAMDIKTYLGVKLENYEDT